MKYPTFAIASIAGLASVKAIYLNKAHTGMNEDTTQFAEVDAQVEQLWWQKPWTSGEVVSNDTFQYGKFIARIKGDDKKGTVTSFFTFWEGNDQEKWDVSNWSEIDGVELVPSAHWGVLSTNIIWEDQKMNPS